MAVSPSSATEDGAPNLVYTFTRNGATTGPLTVNFSVAGTAAFNTDYTQSGAATFSASAGTVNFGAGSSTAAVTVNAASDVVTEADETVVLTVIAGSGYNVASPAAATGTITNDDTQPTISINDVSVSEGDAGNNHRRLYRFAVKRQQPNDYRELCDGEQHGDSRQRLRGCQRYRDLHAGADFPAGQHNCQ